MPAPLRTARRELTLREGDRLLLCSDGFWESVTEKEMLSAAQNTRNAANWLRDMRSRAEAAEDNNTAIALVIGPVQKEEEP